MATLDVRSGRVRAPQGAAPVETTLEAWRSGQRPDGPRALLLPNTVDVKEIASEIAHFDVIILEFPSFRDGRAYSQARLLRERLGYAGEIRARGEILCDQALFMARAGFDVVEIADDRAAGVAEALAEFSAFYQQGVDGSAPVWRRRHPDSKAA